MQPSLLVVEDDETIRETVRDALELEGFAVVACGNGRDALQILQRAPEGEGFSLVVLDLMLPGEDGLSICRRLRGGHDNTPIIMLTAKAEEIDRIVGLEMGADDYLSKPFNPRELLARINAILRRRGTEEHPGAPSQENESIAFGPYTLNLSTRTLTRNGEQVAIKDANVTHGQASDLEQVVGCLRKQSVLYGIALFDVFLRQDGRTRGDPSH